jgi:hypothetical protein
MIKEALARLLQEKATGVAEHMHIYLDGKEGRDYWDCLSMMESFKSVSRPP